MELFKQKKGGQTSEIHSIRVSNEVKEFLKSLENANSFINSLIENTDEFKKWLQDQQADNSPDLFEIYAKNTI